MWGHWINTIPVGESVAGLKNSLAQANNEKRDDHHSAAAKHSLGISENRAIQESGVAIRRGIANDDRLGPRSD